ncbi:transcriptional regulator, SarA/Rot family [Staphylococcus pasteuri]|uniref:transcriptional regulator, SarA/Rot family n=1 Tax=Staphylococcus pasteuri TaxID=45972 RepID=UPI00207CCF55|nr:transcriptional regulator [Staphylococcus pasteuri]MCO0861388.1 transcriptional regulator [Staphylococcus pasteuri]
MSYVKMNCFVAHYMLVKLANDYLKYSYHLTINHVKLLYFILYLYDENKHIDISQLEMYNKRSKFSILKMLQYLYQNNWISKERDDKDQRKLVITMSEQQKNKIHLLFNEIDEMLESRKIVINQRVSNHILYFIKCGEVLDDMDEQLMINNLSLEEVYLLAILLNNDNKMTVKYMRYKTQVGIVSLSSIIEKLNQKGYIIKERSLEDERTIILKLNDCKASLILSIIESCYNTLKQGMKNL